MVLIPWYLIPGRPYPIQIYLYACALYSSNPDLSQRAVAEATRSKFDLETFSHSTVCRSLRSLEEAQESAMKSRFGEEVTIKLSTDIITVSPVPKFTVKDDTSNSTGTGKKSSKGRRFPTVADTTFRRKKVSGFLPKFQKKARIVDIEAAVCRFLKNWHDKFGRLLL